MTGLIKRANLLAVDCAKCGKQIGWDEYVVCMDGFTSRTVTFHKNCAPGMTDVQRHHGAHLNPGNLGFDPKGLR